MFFWILQVLDSDTQGNIHTQKKQSLKILKKRKNKWNIVEKFLFDSIKPRHCGDKLNIVSEFYLPFRFYRQVSSVLPGVSCPLRHIY